MKTVKESIWIGTYKDGLYRLDPSTNKIDHWSPTTDDEKSLSHNYIHDISEDNDGHGTYRYTYRFK